MFLCVACASPGVRVEHHQVVAAYEGWQVREMVHAVEAQTKPEDPPGQT